MEYRAYLMECIVISAKVAGLNYTELRLLATYNLTSSEGDNDSSAKVHYGRNVDLRHSLTRIIERCSRVRSLIIGITKFEFITEINQR